MKPTVVEEAKAGSHNIKTLLKQTTTKLKSENPRSKKTNTLSNFRRDRATTAK